MKTYEVKNGVSTFGVGMVLDLTQEQADVRQDSLTLKGKYYVVNSPVSFKQGEKVGVVAGGVSKKLLESLKDLEKKDETPPTPPTNDDPPEFPKIKHVGFGNYEVFDAEGKKLNDKPIPKAEAETLLKELTKKE